MSPAAVVTSSSASRAFADVQPAHDVQQGLGLRGRVKGGHGETEDDGDGGARSCVVRRCVGELSGLSALGNADDC